MDKKDLGSACTSVQMDFAETHECSQIREYEKCHPSNHTDATQEKTSFEHWWIL